MSQTAAQFTEGQYEKIGEYIRFHFHQWFLEDVKVNGDIFTGKLDRIESSLEASIALSRDRFEEQKTVTREHFSLVEKRFEMMDKRFEMMDKRFEDQKTFTRDRFSDQAASAKENFESLTKRMNRQFTATLAVTVTMISLFGGLLYRGLFG